VTLDRSPTGIPGLDELIQGGFPMPSTILLAGEPGTGKTTLAVQSLFDIARSDGVGIYLTAISEPSWVVQSFLSNFSFYDTELVDTQKVIFADMGSYLIYEPENFMERLQEVVETYQPQRLVIDPITPIKEILERKKINDREFLHNLFAYLKTLSCTTIITGEETYADIPGRLESYMVDGIIMMSYPEEEGVRRKYIEVLKMRGTNHVTGKQLLDITGEGISVQAGLR
jgi:circadian clock protein KaiC